MDAPNTESWPPLLQAGVWIVFLIITGIPSWLGYMKSRKAKGGDAVVVAGDIMATAPFDRLTRALEEVARRLDQTSDASDRSAAANDRAAAAQDRNAEAVRALTRSMERKQ